MATISDKFNRAFASKEAIRQALISKGVDVPNNTPFADYAEKINDISSTDDYYEKFYNIRTDNGTNMAGLYAYYNGNHINVRELNTSNIINMSHMFDSCYGVSVLMLGGFDTKSVTDMSYMFCNCWTLQYLDLSNFDMTNVTDTKGMFDGCNNLYMILLDNCNRDTVSKIINSKYFPTNEIDNYRRKISVKRPSVVGLEAPENWEFSYIEQIEYEEETESLAPINEEVIEEIVEEQELMLLNEEEIAYDADNENLII